MEKARQWYRWIVSGASAPSKRSRAIVGSASALVVLLAVGGAVLHTSSPSPTGGSSNDNSTSAPEVQPVTTPTVASAPEVTPTPTATKPTGGPKEKSAAPTTVPLKKPTSRKATDTGKVRIKHVHVSHRVRGAHRRTVTRRVTTTRA